MAKSGGGGKGKPGGKRQVRSQRNRLNRAGFAPRVAPF
jgi:hypothetical protein